MLQLADPPFPPGVLGRPRVLWPRVGLPPLVKPGREFSLLRWCFSLTVGVRGIWDHLGQKVNKDMVTDGTQGNKSS